MPILLLGKFNGYLVTDEYRSYNTVCENNNIIRIACWAHARRKFTEALKSQKLKTGKAQVAVNYIAKLYRIEKKCKSLSNSERLAIRTEKSAPIIDEVKQWLDK